MKKIRTSFALSPESLDLLKQLAKLNLRSQANMIEQLIKEESIKVNIKHKLY